MCFVPGEGWYHFWQEPALVSWPILSRGRSQQPSNSHPAINQLLLQEFSGCGSLWAEEDLAMEVLEVVGLLVSAALHLQDGSHNWMKNRPWVRDTQISATARLNVQKCT